MFLYLINHFGYKLALATTVVLFCIFFPSVIVNENLPKERRSAMIPTERETITLEALLVQQKKNELVRVRMCVYVCVCVRMRACVDISSFRVEQRSRRSFSFYYHILKRYVFLFFDSLTEKILRLLIITSLLFPR